MMDLAICYLFLAALDSFLKGRMLFFLFESSFFFWSKPFIPIQMIAIIVVLIGAFGILKRMEFIHIQWGFGDKMDSQIKKIYLERLKKALFGFLILGILIGGPFLAKSTYYSGTPLFPFAPGTIMINKNIDEDSKHWKSLKKSALIGFLTNVKNNYGYGRGPKEFLTHFWLISVPDKGVNNQFDYPLGLIYLLVLGPFINLFLYSFKKKEFAIIPFFITFFWLSWWFGSQQTRFLYVPILLMIIVIISHMKRPSKVFISVVGVALLVNALSVYRSHKRDFDLTAKEVLRDKDLTLLEMNQDYIRNKRTDMIDLEFHDAAFAQFPVRVTKESLPHTISL